MNRLILFFIGVLLMGFWPIYDRIKGRSANLRTKNGAGQQGVLPTLEKQAWRECPVCGKVHSGRKDPDGCPFSESEYYSIPKDKLLMKAYTHSGGHFELPFLVWEYNDTNYLTYTPDYLAALDDKYGATLVSCYYSMRCCRKEEWDWDSMKYELTLVIQNLRKNVGNAMYETEQDYVVGLDRILDMSVTKTAGCADTGYVIWRGLQEWRGKQEIYVTGIELFATTDVFNYDKISRSVAIHRFCKAYTRRLCGTIEELREMPQDKLDGTAYGAFMDGAK